MFVMIRPGDDRFVCWPVSIFINLNFIDKKLMMEAFDLTDMLFLDIVISKACISVYKQLVRVGEPTGGLRRPLGVRIYRFIL